MASLRSQSAMEYLMTYGWAILIIAVVLGALFGLGFFNSANLAPKVTAGSCQIYRPYGSGSTSFINFEGACNNELPQYVAQFNGATSYITTTLDVSPNAMSSSTWIIWLYPTNVVTSGNQEMLSDDPGGGHWGRLISLQPGSADYVIGVGGAEWITSALATQNVWQQIAVVFVSNNVYLYKNGIQYAYGSSPPGYSTSYYLTAGRAANANSAFFQGSMADIQVYNTSLSSNEITALYDEGIGGVPLVLNNLVGWWPLNGNAYDYSGDLNNGVVTGLVYTTSWTSGYTAP